MKPSDGVELHATDRGRPLPEAKAALVTGAVRAQAHRIRDARYREALRLCVRLSVAIPGGYALVAAWTAVLGGLLPRWGLLRSDAVVLSAMLGFVLYLLLLLWAFAERRLTRLCGVVFGGLCLGSAVLWRMTSGA